MPHRRNRPFSNPSWATNWRGTSCTAPTVRASRRIPAAPHAASDDGTAGSGSSTSSSSSSSNRRNQLATASPALP